MKKVKIEKSLIQLENLMNDQGVTLFKSNGDYKNFENVFKDVLTTYERAFTRDRIRIIGILDGQDIESEEFIKVHGLKEE
jgi:hypothetical protein